MPLSETIPRKARRATREELREPQNLPSLTDQTPDECDPSAETKEPPGPTAPPEHEWVGLLMEHLNAPQ